MPAFTRELEHTLHNALAEASRRHHEYATLEHLLLALVADAHASAVMKACSVDLDELKARVTEYLDNELSSLFVKGRRQPKRPQGRTRSTWGCALRARPQEYVPANLARALSWRREWRLFPRWQKSAQHFQASFPSLPR